MASHMEQGLKRTGLPQQRGKLQGTGLDQGKKTPIILKFLYVAVPAVAAAAILLWLGGRQIGRQEPGDNVPPPIQTPVGSTPDPTEKTVSTPVPSPSPTIESTPTATAVATPSPSSTRKPSGICDLGGQNPYDANLLNDTNVVDFKFNDEEMCAYVYSGSSDENDNPTYAESHTGKVFIVAKGGNNYVLYEDNIKGKFEFIKMRRLDTYLKEIGKDPVKELAEIHTYDDLLSLYLDTVPENKWFVMPWQDPNEIVDTQTKENVNEVESAEAKMLRTALLNKWLDNEFDSYRQANPEIHKERVKEIAA
jgi:hypothetical protein